MANYRKSMRIEVVPKSKLDAALARIEELEKDTAVLRHQRLAKVLADAMCPAPVFDPPDISGFCVPQADPRPWVDWASRGPNEGKSASVYAVPNEQAKKLFDIARQLQNLAAHIEQVRTATKS